MKYLIYDLETTGLLRTDEAIQFGGILTNDKLSIEKAYNFYGYTQVPIAEKAEAAHGISKTLLHRWSNGKTFEDGFYESSFLQEKDLTWISFSTNGFDERMLNQTLTHNGLPAYDFGSKIAYLGAESSGIHNFDAYGALRRRVFNGRNQRLSQIVNTLPYTTERIQQIFEKKFVNISNNVAFHDALYDSYCLWLVLSFYKSRLGLDGLQ